MKPMELLGFRAEDRVTGFKGVVTSVSFDLYGCIQVALNPGMNKDGKLEDGHWFGHPKGCSFNGVAGNGAARFRKNAWSEKVGKI